MGVIRLGRVELRVMDLEKSVDYYTRIIGLEETGRDEERVYLKAWDEYDHHSVILQQADSAGMDHFGFKVKRLEDLDELEKKQNTLASSQIGSLTERDWEKDKRFVWSCLLGISLNCIMKLSTSVHQWER